MSDFDVAILGAGAAGMMAACVLAEGTADVRTGKTRLRIGVFEKNVRAGIKVLVCGGGRCNFTNAGSVEFLIEQFGRNGRFLTPALRHLDNERLRAFFAERGVPSHEEHDGKIYPDSNRAQSVVDALVRSMERCGVEILTGPRGTVRRVWRDAKQEGSGSGVRDSGSGFWFETLGGEGDGALEENLSGSHGTRAPDPGPRANLHTAKAVILAVGGMSYQRMGTTGDGYQFAEALGHSIVTPRPAIVGLLVKEEWGKALQGLAVEDVEVRVLGGGAGQALPKLVTGRPVPSVNDMLFTHFGLSGPAVLNPSEMVAELLEKFETVGVSVDFARKMTHEGLHALMRGWQQHSGKKLLRKILCQHARDIEIASTSPDRTWITGTPGERSGAFSLPTRLAEKFLELEGIPSEQLCATLTSAQMHRLVERIKQTRFTVTGTRGFKEAMVTAGGVKLSEVDPKTMESKICPGLFLTGEVLDLTGPSGGYNLQLAFSTGSLAGETLARRLSG
ncbi:MAG: NAD(P)/FAD-dependent oxidoreductase [Phycisphaerae bacterium]